MVRRSSGRRLRPSKCRSLAFEALDRKELLSAGAGPSLGSFLAPGTKIPKVSGASAVGNPQAMVGSFLTNQIGPGVTAAQTASLSEQPGPGNLVAGQVVKQPLIRSILKHQDTYDLLTSAVNDSDDAAGDSYSATSTILASALRTATHRAAPNGPRGVPGLRLVGAFGRNRNFAGAEASGVLRAFRIAVSRQVFALSDRQEAIVSAGYAEFVNNVEAMQVDGTFQPSTPPAAQSLPRGPLSRTIEVSLGAFRTLNSVDPSQSGLPLPNVGNFEGRIDIGYVIDRKGNFGIALTARGPLLGSPAGVASSDVVGGDVRIEVSNAPSLSALSGVRHVEGITQGGGSAGGLESSRTASGFATSAASVGYGSGLEFGTGVAYTEVIPLGNAFALIPEYPKQ